MATKKAKKDQAVAVIIGKPNQHFKLPGSIKCVMASIEDKHARGAYKRAMISAELTYQANKKKRVERTDTSKDE
jgi:hypothetical protein